MPSSPGCSLAAGAEADTVEAGDALAEASAEAIAGALADALADAVTEDDDMCAVWVAYSSCRYARPWFFRHRRCLQRETRPVSLTGSPCSHHRYNVRRLPRCQPGRSRLGPERPSALVPVRP